MSWLCPYCSNYNDDDAAVCFICDKPKPLIPVKPPVPEPVREPVPHPAAEEELREKERKRKKEEELRDARRREEWAMDRRETAIRREREIEERRKMVALLRRRTDEIIRRDWTGPSDEERAAKEREAEEECKREEEERRDAALDLKRRSDELREKERIRRERRESGFVVTMRSLFKIAAAIVVFLVGYRILCPWLFPVRENGGTKKPAQIVIGEAESAGTDKPEEPAVTPEMLENAGTIPETAGSVFENAKNIASDADAEVETAPGTETDAELTVFEQTVQALRENAPLVEDAHEEVQSVENRDSGSAFDQAVEELRAR